MEIKYPVKYGVIPIEKLLNYNNGKQYKVVCHIVSKCYIVSEIKKYYEDGSSIMKYEVVCPYIYDDYYNQYVNKLPEFNLGTCINSVITDLVFDTYEDAIEAKRLKNEELLEKQYSFVSLYIPQDTYTYMEAKEKIKAEYDYWQEKYNNIEEVIISQTQDLDVAGESKLSRKIK